jgi:CysZ protein
MRAAHALQDSVITDFVRGALDGLRGASFLAARPRHWKWIVAPALAAAALLVAIVVTLSRLLEAPTAWLADLLPVSWAQGVLHVVAVLVLLVLSYSVFLSVAMLIAAPFAEMLSESIEEELTGVPGPPFRLFGFLWDLLVGLIHGLRRVVLYLVTMGFLLLLSVVIPGIGAIASLVLGGLATARFASYDAYDSVWARRRLRYRDKMTALRADRWRTLGLGALVATLMLVPFVNLVALSIGAAGATLSTLERERRFAGQAAASRTLR